MIGTRALVVACAPALAVAGAGFWIGFTALAGVSSAWTSPQALGTPTATLLMILAHNVPTVLLLYSGVVTGGISTVVAELLLAAYVGATMAAAIANVGSVSVLGSIGGYAPVEFLAFVVAAVAGYLPAAAWVARPVGSRRIAAYASGLRGSLLGLAAALCTILAAGLLETVVITSRTGA